MTTPLAFVSDHTLDASGLPAFEALVGAGATIIADASPARFELVRLPDLVLPDGRVVASDGYIPEQPAFIHGLEPGAHALRLAVAETSSADQRIAFAILGDLATPVERFELALVPGQTREALKPGNYYEYPVDGGTGGFAAATLYDALRAADDLHALTAPAMQRVSRPTRAWCSVTTENGSAALFSSGYGDGLYASYFGIDARERRVLLVTEFNVVAWPRCPIESPPDDANGTVAPDA